MHYLFESLYNAITYLYEIGAPMLISSDTKWMDRIYFQTLVPFDHSTFLLHKVRDTLYIHMGRYLARRSIRHKAVTLMGGHS